MEVAGVALAVASLYNTSLDVLNRVDAYKEYNNESQTTLAHYDAAQTRLRNWAKMLGMADGDLLSPHDARLDDPQIASVIKNLLRCLNKIFDKIESTSSPFKPLKRQQTVESFAWRTPFDDSRNKGFEDAPTPTSKRTRIGWAAGGKSKLDKEVRSFESLVNILYDVVPPRADNSVAPGLEKKLDILSNIDLGLDRLLEIATTQKQKDAEDWLDAPKVDDQYEKHRSVRLDGTCDWILSHPAYTEWISEGKVQDTARVLWINAPAGFGKTVLSARIISQLKLPNSCVAYCYSSNYAHGREQLDAVVRAWLTQLIRENEDALDLVQARRITRKTPRASKDDIWALLDEISNEVQPFTLTLDGLDEFDSNEERRKKFLSRLKKVISSKNVRVLITSRNEVDIESELRPPIEQESDIELIECKIQKENIQSDIDQFSHSIVTEKLPKQDIHFRTELASEIAGRCDGMFLWIKLQQDRLRGGKSKKDLRNIVQAMPQGLHQTYTRSWDSIQALEESDRDRAVNILRWLTFGYQPLTVQQLAEVLIVDLDEHKPAFSEDDLPEEIDEDYIDGEIKGLCGSLVEVRDEKDALPSKSSTVHLVHASVKEFLLKALPASSWIKTPSTLSDELSINGAQHIELAALCIRFLDSSEIWTAHNESPRAFTDYALEGWYKHLEDSKDYVCNAFGLIEKFMRPKNEHFHYWRVTLNSKSPSTSRKPWEEIVTGSPFYYACIFGSQPLVDYFFAKHDCDINAIGGRMQTSLQAVCAWGYTGIFNFLIQQKADVTIPGGDYGSALGAAALFGRIDMVNRILRGKDQKDRFWHSSLQWAMMLAAQNDHEEVITSLLDAGADINYQDWPLTEAGLNFEVCRPDFVVDPEPYRSALHIASQYGRHKVVELLLKRGANVDLMNMAKRTPLLVSVAFGHLEVAKILLDHKADITLLDKRDQSPLWQALQEGNSEIAKLVMHESVINQGDEDGWVPLHLASEHGMLDVISLLIEKGANVNETNLNGWTSLHAAMYKDSTEAVELLLEHGAIIKADKDGWTPVHVAAEKATPKTLDLLFKYCKNIDINAKHEAGWTPLHIAVYNQRTEIVQSLLEHGAQQERDPTGWLPLHLAAQFGPVELAKLLTTKHDLVNVKNDGDFTPLRVAVFNEKYDVAELLLSQGADCDVPDGTGETALHETIRKGNVDLFKRFVANTHNLNTQSTIRKRTPLHAAIEKGSDEMIDILVEKGADLGIVDCYGMNCFCWLQSLRPDHSILQQDEDSKGGERGAKAMDPDKDIIRQTIFDVASLVREEPMNADVATQWRILAHSLAMLGYDDDAKLLYALRTLLEKDPHGTPYCDGCSVSQTVEEPFFICTVCPDVDLCPECMGKYGEGELLSVCKGHRFFEVVAAEAKFRPEETEKLEQWFDGIVERFRPDR